MGVVDKSGGQQSVNPISAIGNVDDRLSSVESHVVYAKTYFASGSTQTTTGSITTGTNSLSVSSIIDFQINQGISIAGAGASGAKLISKITAINGTTITLQNNAGTTVSNVAVIHDDTVAIQGAVNVSSGGQVILAKGRFKVTSTLTVPDNVTLVGRGKQNSIIDYIGTGSAFAFNSAIQFSNLKELSVIFSGTAPNVVGVLMTKNNYCGLHDVMVQDFSTGVKIDGADTSAASNLLFNVHSLRCQIGVHLTANTGKVTNHTNILGGYIGGNAKAAGSKGIFIEQGESNHIIGTDIEDYDTGIHFASTSAGGNRAVVPRANNCTTPYLIDSGCINTQLIAPVGTPITNNSTTSTIVDRKPDMSAENLYWENNMWVKFKDASGNKQNVMGVLNTNDTEIRGASAGGANIFLSISDTGGVFQRELSLARDTVTIRRYLQVGNVASLPTASATYRQQMATVRGINGVAEVDTLTITAGCTTAANAIVTLDGVATNVALATTDNTAVLVATKIRGASFPGWTTGGTGASVTFTATVKGPRVTATYNVNGTGATGNMVTTTAGAGSQDIVYLCVKQKDDTYVWKSVNLT